MALSVSEAIKIYPYQQRWLLDKSRFKVGMLARQTGKTFCVTLEIVLSCLEAEAEGRKERWVILSRGERQAREAMEEGVQKHAKAIQMIFQAHEIIWEGEYKVLELRFPGGSRVTALPANPDTARGFSANVVLDEFAFHQDSRKIWAALFPVISAGHRLRVVSTPNGKNNKFYELMSGDDPNWSRHRVDIYQAVSEGLPRDISVLKSAINDDEAWKQEYELEWLDEATAWLSYELILSCENPQAGLCDWTGGICFLGNDIARRNDLWVAWVIEKLGDVYWTREVSCLRRATFAEQEAEFDRLLRKYRVIRACVDQTGMGEKVVEDYQRKYGATLIEGVQFSPTNKLVLATTGKKAFEGRKIRIPEGDPDLRADLHKLRKVPTATGGFRFLADSDQYGHADRAWACFLALYAASTGVGPIDFEVAAESSSTDWSFF